MEPPLDLPLSTVLLGYTPSHPLIHLLAGPILTRIAWLESLAVRNPPLRRLGFNATAIDVVVLVGLVGAVARWRAQWRAMLGVLGAGEAVLRTVRLLDERDEAEEGTEEEQEQRRRHKEDTKHMLCFWLVYSAISISQSLRATTSATPLLMRQPLTQRLAPLLRRLRALLRPLTMRYPTLAFLAPSAQPAPRRPGAFPQPRPFLPLANLPRPPLPVAWLSSEVKYRLIKLLVLWTALRQDGWGASAIWDWVLGPILSVKRSRRVERGAGKTRRRVKVVLEEELVEDGGSQSPRQDVFAGSECSSSSTTTSPTYGRGRHYEGDTSLSSGTSESPYTHSSSSSSTAFPTPNGIPFRLTSSSHPIRGGLQSEYTAPGRLESPTPGSKNGGYRVEDLLGGVTARGGSAGVDERSMVDSWGTGGEWGPQI